MSRLPPTAVDVVLRTLCRAAYRHRTFGDKKTHAGSETPLAQSSEMKGLGNKEWAHPWTYGTCPVVAFRRGRGVTAHVGG